MEELQDGISRAEVGKGEYSHRRLLGQHSRRAGTDPDRQHQGQRQTDEKRRIQIYLPAWRKEVSERLLVHQKSRIRAEGRTERHSGCEGLLRLPADVRVQSGGEQAVCV